MNLQTFRDCIFLIFAFLLGAWLQDAFPATPKEERKLLARQRAIVFEQCVVSCQDICREKVK